MYDQLKPRVPALSGRPRPMKPQTERQLSHDLEERRASLDSFLLCASQVLEDHGVDILFAPLFTPAPEDWAAALVEALGTFNSSLMEEV